MSTTSRALRLLDLLQARRYWTGEELAGRLGVTTRTVRRDVDRLRELGYRVDAHRGSGGGYSLASGSELPPMLFTDGEAIAIAVGLGTAASANTVTGLDELAVSALAKVEQVLPPVLRRRVNAFRVATVPSTPRSGAEADREVLAVVAMACRDRERLRLSYTSAQGEQTRRQVEPASLVPRGRRWYLVCWDLDRGDWRTLRVDRITAATQTGLRFAPRELPVEDAAEFVDQRFGVPRPDHTARVVVDAPLETAAAYLGGWVRNLEADGERTAWTISDARLEVLAAALVWLPWPFHVVGCPELVTLLEQIGARFVAAAPPVTSGTPSS